MTPETPTPSSMPASTPPAPNSSGKSRIIILVIVIVLFLGAAVTAFFVFDPFGINKSNTNTDNAVTTDPEKKQAITANSISEYKQVCEGKKISNAVAVSTPYKVIPYIKNKDRGLILFAIPDERLSSKQDEVNVVACFIPNESTRRLVSENCEATNLTTNQKVSVNVYVSDYTVTFYGAQTGEVIGSNELVTADPGCPTVVQRDGDIDANPDMVDIKPILDPILAS